MTDPYTTTARLCDDAGLVSDQPVQPSNPFSPGLTYLGQLNNLRGVTGLPPHTGKPFACTGSAHLARQHIQCTNPVHTVVPGYSAIPGGGYTYTVPAWKGSTTPAVAADLTISTARSATPVTPVPMPAALLAEIRQRDEQEGLYSSYSGQEVQDARCDRRALLAEVDRLTAERDALERRVLAECAELDRACGGHPMYQVAAKHVRAAVQGDQPPASPDAVTTEGVDRG